jgi:lipid-A-disaccharide synthase
MAPARAVRLECARAALALLLSPFHALFYLARRGRLEREFLADAARGAEPAPLPELGPLPARPLRLFLSCAEPSGEVHALSLARALHAATRARGAPDPELTGLGGPALAREGVRLLGDPLARAAMGTDALNSIGFYARLLARVGEHFRDTAPDLCLPVDSPALHVPLGGIAHRYGVPVVHFVTPQYWAWAPWRVTGYRRAVDLALSILPFEPAWFRRHGVAVAHVGHPQLDALARVPARDEGAGAARSLVLLPGSRRPVIERNLPWMLAVAARLRDAHPGLELVLPHDRSELEPLLVAELEAAGLRGAVRLAVGDLHGELARARAALSVSGTVLIDLVHHRLPAVVVYRLRSRLAAAAARRALSVPWFASPNMLVGREVLPEFCFHGSGPLDEVAGILARCLADDAYHAGIRAGLEQAARRLGPAGACERAAAQALAVAARKAGARG